MGTEVVTSLSSHFDGTNHCLEQLNTRPDLVSEESNGAMVYLEVTSTQHQNFVSYLTDALETLEESLNTRQDSSERLGRITATLGGNNWPYTKTLGAGRSRCEV